MTSEFQQLSDKVTQLAALASSLRQENIELRLHLRSLTAEKAELGTRIDTAHARVAAVLATLPVTAVAEPELDADADADIDRDIDAESDGDTDADTGSGSGSGFDSDSDSDSESEAAA